ncbi:MAG TPA: hypothetical protein QF753_02730 [Victivallales bacterium]|nr:hypothetical protein [Victivallales bacterium]
MRYTKPEKTCILILSTISIILFFALTVTDFLFYIPTTLEAYKKSSPFIKMIYNIQWLMSVIIFISFIILFFLIIKGIFNGIKLKLKNGLYILSLIFTIIYIILFYPFYFYSMPMEIWIIIQSFAIFFIFTILLIAGTGQKNRGSKNDKIFALYSQEIDQTKTTQIDDKTSLYRNVEKICIFVFSGIGIVSFCYLTIILFQIPDFTQKINNISYIASIYHANILYPDYDFTIIIFVSLCILMFFILKGLWKACILRSSYYFLIYSSYILINIFFIVLYFPAVYNPDLTIIGWVSIHIFGILFLSFLIISCRKYIYRRKYDDDYNAVYISTILKRKYLLILSVLAYISCFISLLLVCNNILLLYGKVGINYIYSGTIINPLYTLCIINYICIIGLWIFNFRIIKLLKNNKSQKIFKFLLYIFIIYAFIYIPKFLNLPAYIWLIIDLIGFLFISFFYVSFMKLLPTKNK